jgi:transposase
VGFKTRRVQRGDPQALGRSRGGFSTKVHARAEGYGKLLTLAPTPDQQHDATLFETLLSQGAVKRPGPGRPKLRPQRIAGDKSYSSRRNGTFARRRGIRITIPHRRNERHRGQFDHTLYEQRSRVKRLFNRMKQFRRLATRYEKRADNYQTTWLIAATIRWL